MLSLAPPAASGPPASHVPRRLAQESHRRKLSENLVRLADAVRYDASRSSSGGQKRDVRATGGIGSNEGMGICHAYAPDRRGISLLKILLTNLCIDCVYCINRRSSNVRRVRFAFDEMV